jgi:type I restriction enzyme S subunit
LKSRFEGIATQSAQLNINLEKLNPFVVTVPPLEEQKAIAEALEDADTWIASLEALIAKKEAIKQGMMQEFLTGRTRLPGFSEAWETTTYGEWVSIRAGSVLIGASDSGLYPVVAAGKEPAGYTEVSNRLGPVITISASGASAGFVRLWDEPIFASDCSTIEPSDAYDLRFVADSLISRQEAIYKAQEGGAQPHVHAKDIYPIPVFVPPLAEQRAIADALSDADAEIAAIRARLAKALDIKQGMMQELLSGRTRLPVRK